MFNLPQTLRNRGFRLFLCGRGVDDLGSEMLPVALVALVLVEHGPLMLGLILGVRGAAGSVFALVSGALLSKIRKSMAMAVNDLIQLAVMLGFAFGPSAATWLVLPAVVSGMAGSMSEPAAGAIMPVIVPREQLREANALRNIVGRTMGITGPAVAGVLLAVLNVQVVFLLIASAFAAGGVVLFRLRERPPSEEHAAASMGGNFRSGLREVVKRPWVPAIIAVATLQAPATIAPGFVLLPIVVADSYAEPVYGLALSCMSAGQLIGGVVAARWSPKRPGLVSLGGVMAYPVVLLALALTVPVPLLLAGYVAAGAGFMMFGVYWYTALQKAIPENLLSVVISIDQVGSFGLEPLGYAASGALAESMGPTPVLVTAAGVGLVSTLVPLSIPGVARLADSPPAGGGERGEDTRAGPQGRLPIEPSGQ